MPDPAQSSRHPRGRDLVAVILHHWGWFSRITAFVAATLAITLGVLWYRTKDARPIIEFDAWAMSAGSVVFFQDGAEMRAVEWRDLPESRNPIAEVDVMLFKTVEAMSLTPPLKLERVLNSGASFTAEIWQVPIADHYTVEIRCRDFRVAESTAKKVRTASALPPAIVGELIRFIAEQEFDQAALTAEVLASPSGKVTHPVQQPRLFWLRHRVAQNGWIAVLGIIAALLPSIVSLSRAAVRVSHGATHCCFCGYSRQGLDAQSNCPECGRA